MEASQKLLHSATPCHLERLQLHLVLISHIPTQRGQRLTNAPSETCKAIQPYLFKLLLMQHHRAVWHSQRKALFTLFCIHEHTDAHHWLASQWLTGGLSMLSHPDSMASFAALIPCHWYPDKGLFCCNPFQGALLDMHGSTWHLLVQRWIWFDVILFCIENYCYRYREMSIKLIFNIFDQCALKPLSNL